ncbi:MAG TPA: hypothetical protein VGM56_01510 [Byssovorax sp.]|jgi:hypothetical protein
MADDEAKGDGAPRTTPGESARPPPSVVAPASILGSRTTPTAFRLVVATLVVVVGAFVYVGLRPRPEELTQRPEKSRAAASASASASAAPAPRP